MTLEYGDVMSQNAFTHDVTVTLSTAAALVNTAPGLGPTTEDGLATARDVTAFFEGFGWSRARCAPHDVEDIHRLRSRLRSVWSADVAVLAEEVNALLAAGAALPRLVNHGQGYGWHIHATPEDAPLGQKVAVEVAMALVELVRTSQSERLQVCSGEHCEDVYVDLSRNRSRKFCDGTCGTRANVAAYRARKAADA